MERFALVVDLGGTKIAAARVDSAGKVTHRRIASTPRGGRKAVVTAVIHLLQQIPSQDVCAIGVDVPGCAYADGTVWAPNLPGWKRMALGAMLKDHFRCRCWLKAIATHSLPEKPGRERRAVAAT